MQQEDQVGERRPLHQVEDVVSADSDVVRAGVDDRGAPGIHSSGWILRPRGVRTGSCYGNSTVTPLVCTSSGANVPAATEMSVRQGGTT